VSSCIPPLDSDFFTQLQRVPDPKHQEHIRQVVGDVVKLFGHNFSERQSAFPTKRRLLT